MTSRSRSLLIDLGLAVTCSAAMYAEAAMIDERTGPAGLVLIALVPLVLFGHRNHPVAVLVGAIVGIQLIVMTSEIYRTVPLAAMVAGYFVVLRTDRRGTVCTGLAVAPVVLLMLAVNSEHALLSYDTFENLATVALPLVLGSAIRDRRAYLAALLERAETAERTREEEARRRVGEERLRIARDIHDVVAHTMVAINVQAGVAAHLVDRDPEQAHHALRDIKAASGQALADLRATLDVVHDEGGRVPVRPAGGLDGLDELAGGLRAAGVDVALDLRGAAEVAPAAEVAAYRIVQEALTNVMRHANATRADVRVAAENGELVISVSDDGAPGPATRDAPAGTGSGLTGMRQRARAIGGTLEAGWQPAGGWRVVATLPVASPP